MGSRRPFSASDFSRSACASVTVAPPTTGKRTFRNVVSNRVARARVGGMNKTEQRYRDRLALMAAAGEVLRFEFERVTLKLADDTRYTPDFYVVFADGRIEFHETKGFERDDALVKFKAAADRWPEFGFVMVAWRKGQWVVTRDLRGDDVPTEAQ